MNIPDTPLMRQYQEVKTRYQDALLMFRMGDFYELFFEDARVAARTLEIALTTRNKNDPNPIPMCGVPHHAATNYVHKLVNSGHKVAICEQLEDPSQAKGIVKRDVVRVVSPGTIFDLEALDPKTPRHTHAVYPTEDTYIWATCDYTTGKFWFGASSSVDEWLQFILGQRFTEILYPEGYSLDFPQQNKNPGFYHSVPPFYFDFTYASEKVCEQFQVQNVEAIHHDLKAYISPIGALIKYFQETQKCSRIPTLTKVEHWGAKERMDLDPSTIQALELMHSNTSLLHWIDHTKTAMGGRLLKEWIIRPLTEVTKITERHEEVETLLLNYSNIQEQLSEIYDMERLCSRLSIGTLANARDLRALAFSVLKFHELKENLEGLKVQSIGILSLQEKLKSAFSADLLDLSMKTLEVLVESLPPSVREGRIFKKNHYEELDTLIELTENGENWLAQYEANERKQTGISSLKVRFNRVFGYYIEVTKANLQAAPLHYIRKQTMVGGERFITEELKIFEEKILTAEKKRCDLEYALFREFCGKFSSLSFAVIKLAQAVAYTDVIASFAKLGKEKKFVRPQLNDSSSIYITEGWHPTVAPAMAAQKRNSQFVSNSIELDEKNYFIIITGPNMGGKSTVMRQTALIVLLAQMGSFVPAKSATIGVVDRVFTRIGAQDNLAEGNSTFMVEMNEMSSILRNATSRSLILVDEIGRGTSTYDGMSLAWALAQEIAENIGARTMFSTHYHELTELTSHINGMRNMRMAVAVENSSDATKLGSSHYTTVRFLYRLEPGSSERSYGILVARLAGLPESVLKNAQTFLDKLEQNPKQTKIVSKIETAQLKLF